MILRVSGLILAVVLGPGGRLAASIETDPAKDTGAADTLITPLNGLHTICKLDL